MTKISIIVPVYNVERYLGKCITSLINQTLKDIEIICINDGSMDSSLEILQKFASQDERIKLLNIENSGQAIARNLGIKQAKGEYIGFVDSDDLVDINYFEKLYQTAKCYDADIACAGFKRWTKSHNSIRKSFNGEILTSDINRKTELDNVPNDCYIWNKIYRRNAWLNANIWFPKKKFFEDVAVILKVLNSLNLMVTVPNTYYNYRKRKGSTVTINSPTLKKDFDFAQKEMLEYAVKNNIKLNKTDNQLYIKFLGFKIVKVKFRNNKITFLLFNLLPLITISSE